MEFVSESGGSESMSLKWMLSVLFCDDDNAGGSDHGWRSIGGGRALPDFTAVKDSRAGMEFAGWTGAWLQIQNSEKPVTEYSA